MMEKFLNVALLLGLTFTQMRHAKGAYLPGNAIKVIKPEGF